MAFHTIGLPSGNIEIYLENGILSSIGSIAAQKVTGRTAVIVSDSNVAPLYGEAVQNSLKESGFNTSVSVIQAGEKSKNINTVNMLFDDFYKASLSRFDVVILLGGGVTGDTGGFAAASYMRGISYIQVPTSLLAQIDSSIGGKTGVDLPYGKNLVGAFYQPLAIVIDPAVLITLPELYLADGMAEAVKYGCIRDYSIFESIEKGLTKGEMTQMIKKCVLIKAKIVENDEHDFGERMLLNFGHTFGHAIERCTDYSVFTHGQAVSIGMIIAAKIGEELGVTPKSTAESLKNVLTNCGLPVEFQINAELLFSAIMADKKRENNIINFILLNEIGNAIIHKIKPDELRAVYERANLNG